MLIIIDRRLPEEIHKKLSRFGELIPFASHGQVYDAISGHPDIFFHYSNGRVVYAPNTPPEFVEKISKRGLHLTEGEKPVGQRYPATVRYNAVATEKQLYGRLKTLDKSMLDLHHDKEKIDLKQGYTACNLFAGPQSMLCSDRGIAQVTGCHYLDPKGILLPGFAHGFIGGCLGLMVDKLLFSGSLKHFAGAEHLQHFAEENHWKLIELYSGPPVDGGGILVLP